jgi:hypothetical protein
MGSITDTVLDAGVVITFLTILRAIVDLIKSVADNRLQLREKEEMISLLKTQKESISRKYFKLKEKYELKNAV